LDLCAEEQQQGMSGVNTTHAPRPWTLVAVGLCFALSGFAALLYQTAWARQFSIVFGTSELAVAIVLAAYMAGLALGARAVEHFLDRVRRPVLVYGILEFGVGIAAIAVPILLLAAEKLMTLAIGGQPQPPSSEGWAQALFFVFTAFVVLVVPTALMGATLPLLTRHVVHTPGQIGSRTGLLYAVNTFGAVGGALAAAYWLLPNLGLSRTVFVGAATNVLVFGLAALISRTPGSSRSPAYLPDAGASAHPARHTRRLADWRSGSRWILPVMLLSGAVSFLYEVLWTRMLSYVLGGSIFAFATMVASFLLGIAAGSLAASQIARARRLATVGFVLSQLAIALCSALTYLSFEWLLPERAGLVGNTLVAIAVLLPSTLFIGATFPFAVRMLTDDPAAAAPAAARVYAWNTVGAIVGALAAGFLIIPELRFEGSIYVGVLVNMALALMTCLLVARAPYVWSAVTLAAGVAVVLLFRPEPPATLLHTSPLNVSKDGPLRYYEVGRSASVVVLEQDGALMLRTNGLPEALIEMPGSAPRFSGEFWLSPLTVIARPRTESMLVIGYGGGVVLDAVPPSVRQVDVIELEPKVIDANRALTPMRKRDPLRDRRVRIILNDARGALALTGKRYDAIVSQPSHPWTAGASHLYTREFMRQARDHLTEGGVFVQWMNIGFLDEDLLRSLAATLLDVFGHVSVYRPDPATLIFLASPAPLHVERNVMAASTPLDLAPRHYARFGIHCPEDVVVALTLDQAGIEALAGDAPLITDDRNRLATDDVYDRGRGLTAAKLSSILESYDPLQRQGSWIHREFGSKLAYDYLARRMSLFVALDRGLARRIVRMGQLLPDPSMATYAQAIARLSVGERAAANRLLRESLALDPANQAARFDMIRPWLAAIAQERAPAEIAAEVGRLPTTPAAIIDAGRHAVAEDWEKIPPLEADMAAALFTDTWYPESIQMRADWRSRVSSEKHRARLAREALAMIEEAIVSQPNAAMFALRARNAAAADRPDVVLESINGYARSLLNNAAQLAPGDLPSLSGNLDALLKALDRLDNDSRVNQARLEQVRSNLATARDNLLSQATSAKSSD
jgi:spermidine synthase